MDKSVFPWRAKLTFSKRISDISLSPSEGHAEILGYTFGNGDITGLRKHIGIVSSFITERLPKHMTAEKIVLTGKYKSSILYKAYGDKELQEAKDMLTSLGAGDLIGRKYHGLSQGEKQICLIARSLMEDPDIIILDEATVGLDLFARDFLSVVSDVKNQWSMRKRGDTINLTQEFFTSK